MTLAEPALLRAVLLGGLVAHKVLWEILKRREGRRLTPARRPAPLVVVKALKVVVLAFLVVQAALLDLLPIAVDSVALRGVGVALFLTGLVVAMIARVQLGGNWVDLEEYRVVPGQSLVARGLYGFVRHPIYAGDLLLLVGLELALNSWLVLGVLPIAVAVVRQAMAEEALLRRALPGYAEYSARTRRFLPFLV
jgi:protein-S-isoprenylcysteine O-methyltransferase Ste14